MFSFEFDAVGECWFGLIVIVLHIYFILLFDFVVVYFALFV